MDSTIIRIPRVADASVPLAVNRQGKGKQYDKPPRDGRESIPNANQVQAETAPLPAGFAETMISQEVIGRLINDFGIPAGRMPQAAQDDKAEAERVALEDVRNQAYKEGFEAGVKDGRHELALQGEKIAGLVESLAELRVQLLREVEDDVVAIVFQAVTSIVGSVVAERAGIADIVRQVIAQVRDRENLVIRVSSKDYDLLRNAFEKDGTAGQRIEVLAEPRILPGGCLVESSAGALDGRLDVQLHSLRELLLGVRGGAANG